MALALAPNIACSTSCSGRASEDSLRTTYLTRMLSRAPASLSFSKHSPFRRGPDPCFAARKSKGFGTPSPSPPQSPPPPSKDKSVTPPLPSPPSESLSPDEDVMPEQVTQRMLKRISFTVGIPLAVALSFFPLFYFLKVVKKVDIPDWLPLFTSLGTFGLAAAGISYGVLSASWDPKREGSWLGWNEAKVNLPVFLESLRRRK